MDRVILYEILKWNFRLANVFMRTCKKINRQLHENGILMHKLSKYYQPRLEKDINFELARIFLDDSHIAQSSILTELETLGNQFNDELAGFNVHRAKIDFNGSRRRKIKIIENILIDDENTLAKHVHDKKRLKTKHLTEIIVVGQHGQVLKTHNIHKVIELFNKHALSVIELNKLEKIYRWSVGYRLNENEIKKPSQEEITCNLLNHLRILFDVVEKNQSQRKEMELMRSSPNNSIKYFLIIIALLYMRYTFMK